MPNEVAERPSVSVDLQEKVLLGGDLSKLTPAERLSYYSNVCLSLDLNPLTRPFEYLTLNNKMVLYARKDCTEQLRTKRQISVVIASREVVEGVYVVTARATDPTGRADESIGAVPIDKLVGNDRANAMMKAETKAKRRVTLSICGLGMLDETEIETIKDAKPVALDIPQVRPRNEATMVQGPTDKYTGERQGEAVVDAGASGVHIALQGNDVPAPKKYATHLDEPAPSSAKAFCEEQASKAAADEHEAEGYIGTYQPRGAGKSAPPGRFTLDTLHGEIVLQFWEKPEGMGTPNHSYAKVTYRQSERTGKGGKVFTNNELLSLHWAAPPQ